MNKQVGAQLNYTQNTRNSSGVVDIDDLWIKNPNNYASTPGVYTRHEKDNEIDLLWAGLKENQKSQVSPIIYLGTGFVAGIITAVLVTTVLFWGTGNKSAQAFDVSNVEAPIVEEAKSSIKVPAETNLGTNVMQNEYKDVITYTIQSGDSLGLIAERFYKSSAPKYVQMIQRANNLNSAHSITAGKKLIIPVKQ